MCKTCNKCKIPYDDVDANFGKTKNIYNKRCKKCSCDANKKYRINNPDKIKEKKLVYNTNNPDKIKQYYITYNKKRTGSKKDSKKEYNKSYQKLYKERIKETRRNRTSVLTDTYMKQIIKYSKSVYVENPTPDYIEKVRQLLTSITPEDFSSVSKETARNII